MAKRTITAICQEGLCPLCGGELSYHGTDHYNNFHRWTCDLCDATGKEGFDEEYVFDEHHYDVKDADGNDIEILDPATGKPPAATTPKEEPAPRKVTIQHKDIGICPICGTSNDVEMVKQDNGYGDAWYEGECANCGSTFHIDFRYIQIIDGYSEVQDQGGDDIDVEIVNAPLLDAGEVASLIPMCCECDSNLCVFNPDGICRYPLVYGKEPESTFNGCSGCLIYDNN